MTSHIGIVTGKPAGVQTSTRTHTHDIPVPVYPRVPTGKGLCAGMVTKYGIIH
jgi:hypothetical protein